MTLFLLLIIVATSITAIVCHHLKGKAQADLKAEQLRAQEAIRNAEETVRQKLAELEEESARMREHYQLEARKVVQETHAELEHVRAEMELLRPYSQVYASEADARQKLAIALDEVAKLESEAEALLEQAQRAALDARKAGNERAKSLYTEAEAQLIQATKEAGKLTSDAEKSARMIAGDAYAALRDKETLEQALVAINNTIQGYGDRYIIPTHSLLDDLASDFGHTAAGRSLKSAREQSHRMVKLGYAATCDYEEADRKAAAERFVVDAFNGRAEAILSRVKHNNFGTLEQEIKDAFSLVNLNAIAFRNARVLENYRDARISELRWAVILQELKLKEREEQRQIQEQIREEEKARREYEKAIQEAAKEEEILRKAMARATEQAARANAEDRAKFEAQLAELSSKLSEAEAKNQRALSMAQQTRSGHVYIISNLGSFGEDVLKIGMTRRLEPEDRIKELGDASVPFGFDVHAMIKSDDAPALEYAFHKRFGELRVNKVNLRKEFFKVSIHQLREFVADMKLEATFTIASEAREYRETMAFEKMTPEERTRYQIRETEVVLGEN